MQRPKDKSWEMMGHGLGCYTPTTSINVLWTGDKAPKQRRV